MFRIAICDETQVEAEELSHYLSVLAGEISLEYSVEWYPNVRLFQKALQGTRFQLVFLETRIGGVDGVELARRLRIFDEEMAIVFCSSETGRALEAYSAFPSGYLVKPVSRKQLREIIRHVADKVRKKPSVLLRGEGGGTERIGIDDILYIEVLGEALDVHCRREILHCAGALVEAEALLPSTDFYRCHRNCIVNFRYAVKIERYQFRMLNGDSVAIAKNRYAEVKAAFELFAGKSRPRRGGKDRKKDVSLDGKI